MARPDLARRSTRAFPLALAALSLLLAALDVWAVVREHAHPPVPIDRIKWVALAAAPAEAAASGKPLLYIFLEAGDTECDLLRREVFARPGLSDVINRVFVPVRIQNPDPRSREEKLTTHFNIRRVPSMVVCTPAGRWVASQDRYAGRLSMESWVNAIPAEVAAASRARRP